MTRKTSLIRKACLKDVAEMLSLYKIYTGRELRHERVAESIINYPSCVAEIDNEMVGFAYTNKFAPDIIELLNIYLSPQERSNEIGSLMLQNIEIEANENYKAIILVNSMLYDTNEDKRPATNFYERNGYHLIMETRNTKVFEKKLCE